MSFAITADFKTVPYIHQLTEFEEHAEDEARALLWQMRTGKTKVIIDRACHLYLADKIDGVLLFAPNGVHENWIRRELPIHHWDTVPRDTIYWRTEVAGKVSETNRARRGWQEQHDAFWDRAKRLLRTKDRLPWFAFASDTMTRKDARQLVARVIKNRKRLLMVFDESDDFRTPGSTRSQMARAMAKRGAYRVILSGTVVENSPLAAWGQYELLEPGALGFRTYELFEGHHAVYEQKRTYGGRQYPKLKEYVHLDELRERMSRFSSVVLRSDCQDLPDLIPEQHVVELTEEQRRVYTELHSQFLIEVDGKEVSIGENTQKLIKLQQVVSGFIKDEFGAVHRLPGGNPRLEGMLEQVRMATGKVIIWCAFHEDMDQVSSALRANGYKVLEYHGRVSPEDKARAREAFAPEAENDVKALVGYPTAGLDLSAAEKILWYSHVFNAIKRSQADERATAMGGENVLLVDFMAPGVDHYIRDNVVRKVDVAEDLARSGMREVLERCSI